MDVVVMNAAEAPRIGSQNPWIWFPANDAQTFQSLVDNGVEVVYGQVECRKCEYYAVQEINLQEAFIAVKNQLVEERVRVLQNHLDGNLFKNWTYQRMLCPNCKKISVVPVIPPMSKIPRDLGRMNLLFLFLGGYLRFMETRVLRGILVKCGFPTRPIYGQDLPGRCEPKQCFHIAAQYVLARILEPENAALSLGAWPVKEIWNP